MEKTSSKHIKKILREVFPKVYAPWCSAMSYPLVDMEWLESFLKQNTIDSVPFEDEERECEWFALQLHADVKKEKFCAFGEAFGTSFQNMGKAKHYLNFCVGTDEKAYCIEPQSDFIWLAKRKVDNVLLYKM